MFQSDRDRRKTDECSEVLTTLDNMAEHQYAYVIRIRTYFVKSSLRRVFRCEYPDEMRLGRKLVSLQQLYLNQSGRRQ